ncbi:hypothetical protein AMK21_25455 [Streptomyces sp. CB00316]|uniref:hypothetical protein n=1 Tax=Streptomyces sp. CB00316 TaxID=1703932 RepID=UPI00093A7D20|nr:hypothetical protein [Streptomyces sp. CB00316]OKJ17647.1 hypothetical protein AMK21_25455 [Streptomyces sp. CB00316]
MTTTLPVPIAFELPDGWRATPPDGVGATGAAFVALHPHPDAGFTANITIDGEFRLDAATLPEIADESVENLRRSAASVDIAERRKVGSEDAPGLTQTLAVSVVAGGTLRNLVQSQVYLAMLDVTDPSKRAVIRLILTVTSAQHSAVIEDFRDFVRTVRPDTDMTS